MGSFVLIRIRGGLKMKKSKEEKICTALFGAALVLYAISMVIGLIPNYVYSTDKICGGLGFVCFCLGLIYLKKVKDSNGNEDK